MNIFMSEKTFCSSKLWVRESITEDKLDLILYVCCGMGHLTSGCSFCRRSSRRSTWLPTWTRGVWWTCRSTKVAPEWSGKTLGGGEGARAPLTHLPTQSVICLSEPAQRLLFFPLGGTEHDCVYITLLALREIKAVMWLCCGKTKQRDFLPYFNLGGKFVRHCYKNDGFKLFHLVSSWLYTSPPCHHNVIPYCKMHVVHESDVCRHSDNTSNSCQAIGCIFSSRSELETSWARLCTRISNQCVEMRLSLSHIASHHSCCGLAMLTSTRTIYISFMPIITAKNKQNESFLCYSWLAAEHLGHLGASEVQKITPFIVQWQRWPLANELLL